MTAAAPTPLTQRTTRLGLGVGMDLPWGERIGFAPSADGGDVTPRVRAFLRRHEEHYGYSFFAFQPRDRARLRAADYVIAYDRLYDAMPAGRPRAFHQTLLNMGTPECYDRRPVADFTNELHARYGFSWVVEDLGIWSLQGRPLPYPLPPVMTERGLERATSNAREARELLEPELHVEFPGFTEGGSFVLGAMDAFDYFRRLADDANVWVTLDVGHLLSYQWLRGRTGPAMYEGLESLPLERCRELHLSGCQIVRGKFRDLHHGVLLDEQIDLTRHLLPRCPNLLGVTYEDPVYNEDGELTPKSRPNYERLRDVVMRWMDGEAS
ncbi:multinuclear nonheme iron-dependent oxidase [Streptomyces mauvecolor]